MIEIVFSSSIVGGSRNGFKHAYGLNLIYIVWCPSVTRWVHVVRRTGSPWYPTCQQHAGNLVRKQPEARTENDDQSCEKRWNTAFRGSLARKINEGKAEKRVTSRYLPEGRRSVKQFPGPLARLMWSEWQESHPSICLLTPLVSLSFGVWSVKINKRSAMLLELHQHVLHLATPHVNHQILSNRRLQARHSMVRVH